VVLQSIRYLPTKSNREIGRVEKEVNTLILKVVNERKEAGLGNDLLHMILEAATTSGFSQDETERFIVDNCKNIYLAGYETTAISTTWTLMLLASNPEWQDRVRAEVLEVCGGQMPDADMVRKMKTVSVYYRVLMLFSRLVYNRDDHYSIF
jgi:cytochrome P450